MCEKYIPFPESRDDYMSDYNSVRVIAPDDDSPALACQTLKRFSEAGMNIVKSTDCIKQ